MQPTKLAPSLATWSQHAEDVAALQNLMGPFDTYSVSISYSPRAGYTSASFSASLHQDADLYLPFTIGGPMVTDPVLVMLAALGEGAHRLANPTLF